MPERPDFVFSGVNHGPNMGEDVLYSGTVSAAMEAVTLGVPGIGDLVRRATSPRPCATYRDALAHAGAARSRRCADFPAHTLLNINLPPVPAERGDGASRSTKLGSRYFSESLTRMKDPWGREIFWIGGGTITWTGGEHSDHAAVAEGYISVTPLHMDLTNYAPARDGAGMVAGGLGAGDSYGGYRSRLVETLQAKGIRDLAVLRAVEHGARATCSCPRACATAPTRTRRCRSAAARPSRSRGCRRATSSCCGLTGRERVLEVGTGSGYQTALLALLADAVFASSGCRRCAQSARAALAGRRHPERDGAGGRRHARLAPVSRRTTRSWWRRRRPRSRSRWWSSSPPGGRLVIPLGDQGQARSSPW